MRKRSDPWVEDPCNGYPRHLHEVNVRRSAQEAVTSWQLEPITVDELVYLSYGAGSGDPWVGWMSFKEQLNDTVEGARDRIAVLRSRLSNVSLTRSTYERARSFGVSLRSVDTA